MKKKAVRTWDGIEVVEAKGPLRVFLMQEDLMSAERQNPQNCVFARAVRRSCGSSRVVFLKTIAYVELLQADGSKKIERYEMPHNMRKLIEEFDRTGVAPIGGFTLHPARPSVTLDGKSSRNRSYRSEAVRRKALLLGETRLPQGTKGEPIVHGVRVVQDVRHGSSMVHFPRKT